MSQENTQAVEFEVHRGQHLLMDDHEDLIEVIVVSVGVTQHRVIDRQGFFHMAVVMDGEDGVYLRSIVAGAQRKGLGYNAKLHVRTGWSRLIETVVTMSEIERYRFAS